MNPIRPDEREILIDALGVRTRVLDAGRGPVVVMLHGNPDNADEWRPLIEQLAPRHRCIAPDFPGYGRATLPTTFRYTLAEQVQFLDAVLDAMHIAEPFVLVVHDTGGMVGTAWAAANPQRLRGFMVTNTVAFERFPWFAVARQWGNASWLGRARAALGMHALGLQHGALFRRVFGRQSPQLSSAELDRFATSFALNPVAKRATLRQFRQFVPAAFFTGFDDMRQRLLAQVPCRVLWGDRDPYLPVRLAHDFGATQVTVLPQAGHWVPIVAAQELAAQIEAFR